MSPQTTGQQQYNNNRNDDSGRESPTTTTATILKHKSDAAGTVVRRRRHRSSKHAMAWLQHTQTVHPRTQKPSIEKLMKLILEQGETIQQQLTKLR